MSLEMDGDVQIMQSTQLAMEGLEEKPGNVPDAVYFIHLTYIYFFFCFDKTKFVDGGTKYSKGLRSNWVYWSRLGRKYT